MNILIFSWRGPGHPNAGGAEQVTVEHAKAWIKKGHEVTLLTSTFPGGKFKEVVNGIEVIRRGNQFFGVHVFAFLWYLLGKHKKFDLVIDQFHGIPFFTPLFVKSRKLAFIHEVAKEVWKLNPWPKPLNLIPSFIGPLIEPLIIGVIYKKTHFMTVSESTKQDLISLGINKKNITVVHNGVRLFLPRQTVLKEIKYTAIYLGPLSLDKGVFDAIEAFGQINRKSEDWQFWVVGAGTKNYLNKIKEISKSLGIYYKIKHFGFVSDRKKFELLSKAHVLINPSVHEGWGLVNIEANGSGIPVVGYDVKGMKDSVINNKTGLLVTRGDFHGLADSSLKLVSNKQLYKNFQIECKKWASKFTWQKASDKSLQLIESI